jgi:phage shock protein PspC (stress-responsive transcriptional regulator)
VPTAYAPPAPDAPAADEPLPPPATDEYATPPPGGEQATPPGGEQATPPGGEQAPPTAPPSWFGAPNGPPLVGDKLVRPAKGRYVAGVCAALGRATNTDPVLWRVLLAVLSFFSGVGVLIYLIGWLLIPSEGDSASPVESLLGRGRSGMQPISVVLLGCAAALTFAVVVHGGFRATLVAVAVVFGTAMLLRRTGWDPPNFRPFQSPEPRTAAFPFGPGGPSAAPPQPDAAFAASAPPAAPAAGATTAPASAGEPVTTPLPPTPPNYTPPNYTAPQFTPPQFAPPTGGYRPPFAPHGPWAGSRHPAYGPTPPPKAPKAPKPPRERSKLGRITFFAVLVVIGALALINSAGVGVPVSAFFAASLATIAVGLIVGAWLGRARGLIFLAFLATFGLVLSSGAERYGDQIGRNDFRPKTVEAVADRYDFTVGNATIDLRAVDFSTAARQDTTVVMKFGQVKVLLPDNVDSTVSVDMDGGRANVFGKEWDGKDVNSQDVTDLGADGAGGGNLHLTIQMDTGNVEVSR